VTWATRKLDCQPLAFEVAAMECWHNISRIHRIFIFDETKPIHELNLCDFASSMCAEVVFNILLGSITRKIAQVKAGT